MSKRKFEAGTIDQNCDDDHYYGNDNDDEINKDHTLSVKIYPL